MDWQNARQRAGRAAETTSRSLWLVLWFAVCFAVIFCTMAAQQFQTRMDGSTDDTKYAVGYVLLQVSNLDEQQAYKTELKKSLKQLEALASQADLAADQAEEKAGAERTQMGSLLEKTALPDPEKPLLAKLENDPRTLLGYQDALNIARDMVENIKGPIAGPDPQKQLGDFEGAVQDFAEASNHAATQHLISAQKDQDYKTAIAAKPQPPFDKPSFEQLADDLSRYQKLFLGWPFAFVAIPSIMLTLMLTVMMGILGSLIALTCEIVFDNTEQTVGQYLFRIGLGASVALSIFLFAGAGMLTVAQTSGGDHGNVELSPYLVSFLGIVSGYLSRRVTRWMGETGARVFPVKEEANRWALDLTGEITAAGTTADALAAATELSAGDIDLWAQRKAAIPFSAQGLIAAFLRKPAYRLFSDIAPPP